MFYPVMMEITNRKVVIVGGGKVAYRKSKKILEYGGDLTILSPEIIEEFDNLKEIYKENLNFIYDKYNLKYIEDAFLVISATCTRTLNKQIGKDCKKLNILVNLADSKEESDFITPAVINNDNLTISISTMGSFPYLCKKIRKDMEKQYVKFNKEYMDVLEEIRSYILKEKPDDMRGKMDEILELELDELKKVLKSYHINL